MNREINTIGSKAEGGRATESSLPSRPSSSGYASRCRMSSRAAPAATAVRRLRPLGHRQDDGGRAAGRSDARPGDVAVLHVAARRAPASVDGVDYNFISRDDVPGDGPARRFSSGPMSSATSTAPAGAKREPRWRPGPTLSLSSTCRAPGRYAPAGHGSVRHLRAAPVVCGRSSGGCAAAARTRKRRFGGASRPRGAKSRQSSSTTTWSSTTSSTAASRRLPPS